MLYEPNIEKFIDLIVAYVELFELLKCLDTLNVLELASTDVQESDIFEGSSDVTKTWDYRIVQLQVLKTREDFSSHLQIVKVGVHS